MTIIFWLIHFYLSFCVHLSGSVQGVVKVQCENKLSRIDTPIPLREIYLAVLWKKILFYTEKLYPVVGTTLLYTSTVLSHILFVKTKMSGFVF